ncbi:hypothetical protein NS212_05710 [Pseudomonas parafulva]|nr:hypothetical protein NS212_05710 [Pseudomonas parafulva]
MTGLPDGDLQSPSAKGFGLPPSGDGSREPNPGCARFWPCGLPSSSLWPFVGRRAPLAVCLQTVITDRFVSTPARFP